MINHIGINRSHKLRALCKSIWCWAVKLSLWFSVAHMHSRWTRRLSRYIITSQLQRREWMLNSKILFLFFLFTVLSRYKTWQGKATKILVIPDWPTHSWYPKAMQMTTQALVVLEPRKRPLTLPSDSDASILYGNSWVFRSTRCLEKASDQSISTNYYGSLANSHLWAIWVILDQMGNTF